ncbi:MAG: immunity 49 family protein [Bacteroidota bacterium]
MKLVTYSDKTLLLTKEFNLIAETKLKSAIKFWNWITEDKDFNLLIPFAERVIEYTYAANLNKNNKDKYELFNKMLYAISFYSINRGRTHESVQFGKLKNNKILIPEIKKVSSIWEYFVYVALISRNSNLINSITSIDSSLIDIPEITNGHRYKKAYIQFLISFINENQLNDSYLDLMQFQYDATEEIIPEFKSDFSFWIYLYEPIVSAIKALSNEDKDSFKSSLVLALNHHKSYWSSSKPMNKGGTPPFQDYEGLVSFPCTALAAIAVDKGWDIGVKSDYMPQYMVDGSINK